MRSRLRIASRRHARPSRTTSAMQASRVQRANRCSSSASGSPSPSARPNDRTMKAAHCAGAGSHSHAAIPRAEGGGEPQGQLRPLGLEKLLDPPGNGAKSARKEKRRCAGSSGASSMLGALTQSIWPDQTKESAPQRKRQYDQRKQQDRRRRHPLRPLADRLPPHRRRAHRAVQLAVRPPPRRQISAAHRGYRQGRARPSRRSTRSSTGSTGSASSGDGEPYFQSQFEKRHAEVAHQLIERGAAYRCYLTQEELAARRETAQAERRPFRIDSEWRDRDRLARAGRPALRRPHQGAAARARR